MKDMILVAKLATWALLCYYLFVAIFPIPEDASNVVMEDNPSDDMPKEKEIPKRRKGKVE